MTPILASEIGRDVTFSQRERTRVLFLEALPDLGQAVLQAVKLHTNLRLHGVL